jgi:hypothetical protein
MGKYARYKAQKIVDEERRRIDEELSQPSATQQ